MLKNILAVTGKPGLFKLVSRGQNMLIVESLLDGKRMPTYARDKIVSLADVSMFTTGDDLPLSEVLTRLGKKEDLKPDFDRDRVYPSDIRKLIQWYNVLVNAGITDFSVEEESEENAEAKVDEVKAEPKAEKHVARNTAAKTSQKAAGKSAAKTGVGAKKG